MNRGKKISLIDPGVDDVLAKATAEALAQIPIDKSTGTPLFSLFLPGLCVSRE